MSARIKWVTKAVAAEALARQMAAHAYCEEHSADRPVADCPFCADRAAYAMWLACGGADYRPAVDPDARHVTLAELRRQHCPES